MIIQNNIAQGILRKQKHQLHLQEIQELDDSDEKSEDNQSESKPLKISTGNLLKTTIQKVIG